MHITRTRATRATTGAGPLVAVLTAVALLLAGCGGGGAPAASEPGAYTVTHAKGETALPAEPARVVVLDSPHLDALVALGITPVGASESSAGVGFPGYLADRLAGTESTGLIAEPNLETVARLEPDLIIGSAVRHDALYEQLSRIAPTVFSVGSGTDWEEQARVTAAAVNRTARMEELLGALRTRAAEVGREVGAPGRTASIVRFRTDTFRLYGPRSFSGSVLTSMGFDLGERDWDEYSMIEVAPELHSQIDGDVIFFTDPARDPAAGARATVTGLWEGVAAVRSGAVHEMEDETWMVGIGVLGAGQIVDQVRETLAP